MTRNRFIAKVVNEALQCNVTVKLLQQKSTCKLGGWFSGKELVVAMGNACGFETLIHEYCHMVQQRDNCLAWRKYNALCDNFFYWHNYNMQLSAEQLQLAKNAAIALEHDCEKRALQCIRKYKLDVNVEYYTQCANLYLYSHHIIAQTRTFNVEFSEHNLNMMPKTLLPLKYYLSDCSKTMQNVSQLLK